MQSIASLTLSRRHFLRTARGAAIAFAGLPLAAASSCARTTNASLPLISDPHCLLDLPRGFSYSIVSRAGELMSDGFFRPGNPDGMACFPHPNDAGRCVLLRNHENWPDARAGGAFGPDDGLVAKLADGKLYDRKTDGRPFLGGVTTLVYDLRARRLDRDFLSLAGTAGNCAGGATPWGSWLSCEESEIAPKEGATRPHGFVFEVSAAATGPVDPSPLKAMGRFRHEAAAVDPHTGVVYLTEDASDGLFYRFLPSTRKELAKGGRLQALAVRGWKSADLRNQRVSDAPDVKVGQDFKVEWIDLVDVEAPDRDLRLRGHKAGAALFCRGEGAAFGLRPGEAGAVYFNCTEGGQARAGQVWRYRPAPDENSRSPDQHAGVLTLLYESPGPEALDRCDNIAVSPAGDLILCEDGGGEQFLRALTPAGRIIDVARNAHASNSEFCGACFSPDGAVMFINIQTPGITLAIEGPWSRLSAA